MPVYVYTYFENMSKKVLTEDGVSRRLEVIPMWATPHEFTSVSMKKSERPRDLFTYGPIAEDAYRIVRALTNAKQTPKAVVQANRSLGLEWINSISEHPYRAGPSSTLGAALDDAYGLKPGLRHTPWNFYGERSNEDPPDISALAVSEFRSGAGTFPAQLFGRTKPYFDELTTAADESRAMNVIDPTPLLNEIAAAVISHAPQVFRNYLGERVGIGLIARRLDQRVLLELLDLLVHQILVSRCPACNRIWVPSAQAPTHCRRYFWDALTFDPLRGCVSDDKARGIVDEIKGATYRKEYQRQSKALERLKAKLGSAHPEVLALRRARDDLRVEVGPTMRGRPPKPLPTQAAPAKPSHLGQAHDEVPTKRRH